MSDGAMTSVHDTPILKIAPYLKAAWSRETSADPKNWTYECPSWGQCAVTALAVHNLFTKRNYRVEILRIGLGLSSDPRIRALGSHYYNVIDGAEVDFTADQFGTAAAYEQLLAEAKTRRVLPNDLLRDPELHRKYDLLYAELLRITGDTLVKN